MDDITQDVARPTAGRAYRFCRALVRLWFALSFRKIRCLGGERLPEAGPVLLAVGHLASFPDALILVAALDRPVSCLIPQNQIQHLWPRLWARWLNMIPYEPEAVETRGPGVSTSYESAPVETPRRGVSTEALDACVETLASEGVVAVFADPAPQDPACAEKGGLARTAASIAVAAKTHLAGPILLLPVHMFLPVQRSQAGELLIYVDSPLALREEKLDSRLESIWWENPFRLQGEDLERFTSDMEEVLRENLADEFAARPNWKQRVEGFQLSAFVAAWAEQANYLHPGRLVSLREMLEAFREGERRKALHQAEVEAARDWLDSPLRRGSVWSESVLGFLVALYGLCNHLLALLILYWTGLLKRKEDRDPRTEWLLRGAVVVGCYAVQVLLVAFWLGRSAAGYYAPALPVTGLYLWRYRWLLRHRTHLAWKALLLHWQDRKVRRLRRRFVEELDKTMQAHAELLGERV